MEKKNGSGPKPQFVVVVREIGGVLRNTYLDSKHVKKEDAESRVSEINKTNKKTEDVYAFVLSKTDLKKRFPNLHDQF